MSFDVQGRKIAYQTPDGAIMFVRNDRDVHAYDLIIQNRDHLYIPDRTLGELTSPARSTHEMMESMDNLSGGMAAVILEQNRISPQDLHMALLHLRITELEEECDGAYRNQGE